jgi:acetyl/propionyl-CoA carboxylase alpha subunit
MHKVLIANRGEIACRIGEAAKGLGIETVAVYSDADRHAKHVRCADEAFWLGPSDVNASYLNQTKLIELALQNQCDAIHPGYGLLSEKADFAKACEEAGLNFIGPKSDTIAQLGDKAKAKALAQSLNIPVSESVPVPDVITAQWCEAMQSKGRTWLIKACCGGGGRGMRRVTPEDDLLAMLNAARREAKNYFDDDSLLLERLIEPARHIEVQIIADKHGNVRHLFDRDCSVQRRYQKVIEEAPALGIDPQVRQAMFDAAIKLAEAVHYQNVGTVEFLVDTKQQFYFLEMNTRVQVEHPVTELICQQDIVQWQFKIADGAALDRSQSAWNADGVAIEVRLCAEQPAKNFMPSVGRIQAISWPDVPYARIDSGFDQGDVISPYYDSMLAKIIVWGEDRRQAIAYLQQALNQTWIEGIDTNRDWLVQMAYDPIFQQGQVNTDYLKANPKPVEAPSNALICALTAVYACMQKQSHKDKRNWFARGHWRQGLQPITYERWLDDQCYKLSLEQQEQDGFIVSCDGKLLRFSNCEAAPNALACVINGDIYQAYFNDDKQTIDVHCATYASTVFKYPNKAASQDQVHDQAIRAPLPGVVVNILVQEGDQVKAGQTLMVMEAMKMEHPIKALCDGQLVSISAQMNDRVPLNAVLAIVQ